MFAPFVCPGSGILLDQNGSEGGYANVWYSGFKGVFNGKTFQSTFKPTQLQNGSATATINQDDTPYDGPPTLVQRHYQLAHMTLEFNFAMYICAQTDETPSTYVEQSSLTWAFNGSGTLIPQQNYLWQPDNATKVTPGSWGAQITSGAAPKTVGPIFNSLVPLEWR